MQKVFTVVKAISLAAVFFLAYIFQETPGLFALFGVKPLALLAAAAAVPASMGSHAGWAFAVPAGFVWDICAGMPFGLMAVFLFLLSTAVSLLFDYYLKPKFINLCLCMSCAMLLYFLLSTLIYGAAFMDVKGMLVCFLYTLFLSAAFYLPLRAINRRRTEKAGSE